MTQPNEFYISKLTITSWFTATPHSITPTSPGSISIESVASVTGVGGIASKGVSRFINHSIGGSRED